MVEVKRPKITAIIPAYNEEATVAEVVRVACSSKLVDEVLVVSDGSTDNTVETARAAGARVLDLKKNHGKGAAMRLGVLDTNAPIILFLDADLVGFTTDHIERLVWPVITGGRAMNAAQRDRGILNPIVRYLPLISGERAMTRDIFLAIPEEYSQGFMVEIVLNYYCRFKKLRYGSVLLPGLTIRRKYQKVGWRRGLREYFRMTFQIIKAMIVIRLARLFRQF
ncbi:MAG: glycosyltransferase [Patescibacteria group bacterium]|jgi:glycosyltransferase involved in cell wall biosynthesis